MEKNPAAVKLGRMGGKVKSDAKTRAARENSMKAAIAKRLKRAQLEGKNTPATSEQKQSNPETKVDSQSSEPSY